VSSAGLYAAALPMLIGAPPHPNLRCLTFLRWCRETDRLDHPACGPARGEFVAGPMRGPAPRISV
jgi:hypothetical protein